MKLVYDLTTLEQTGAGKGPGSGAAGGKVRTRPLAAHVMKQHVEISANLLMALKRRQEDRAESRLPLQLMIYALQMTVSASKKLVSWVCVAVLACNSVVTTLDKAAVLCGRWIKVSSRRLCRTSTSISAGPKLFVGGEDTTHLGTGRKTRMSWNILNRNALRARFRTLKLQTIFIRPFFVAGHRRTSRFA